MTVWKLLRARKNLDWLIRNLDDPERDLIRRHLPEGMTWAQVEADLKGLNKAVRATLLFMGVGVEP